MNIDYQSCAKFGTVVRFNSVTEPARITQSSSAIIEHLYSTNSENDTECFVLSYLISDYFPVCVSRKIRYKILATIFRSLICFKNLIYIILLLIWSHSVIHRSILISMRTVPFTC